MSSTQHIAIESGSTEKMGRPTNTPEKDAQLPPPVDPYLPQQTWAYLQYLLPLTAIFVFPLIFASYVYAKHRVIAHQGLASFAMSYPQAKGQVVAILATSLTATTRWALGGAAALLARKRLLQPRPIYEIDMFFSLRNISVIWDWKHRRRLFLLTWFLVVVCGLLTSGFFTLINPLAVDVEVKHPSAREINFAATTAFDYLMVQYEENQMFPLPFGPPPPPGSDGTSHITASLSDVPSMLQSMTRQYLASKNQSNVYPVGSFVTTFAEMLHPSFIGGTSGVVITGPVVPGSPSFPFGRPEPGSPSYSLDLQGTWMDVSCSMGTTYPLNVTLDDALPAGAGGYNFTCPGSSTLRKGHTESALGVILALDCPMEDDTIAIFFRWLGPNRATYGLDPVNNITCKASPRIGDVNVVLNSDFNPFNATKKRSTAIPLSSLARGFTNLVLSNVISIFSNVPVFHHTSQAWDAYRYDNDEKLHSMLLELTPMIISTLFEFEASYVRLILTHYAGSLSQLPPELVREVKVVLNERTIGWEVKWTTWLGLVPLVAVCIITFAMIAMAFLAEGELTAFDPMSPVSLLGATSVAIWWSPNLLQTRWLSPNKNQARPSDTPWMKKFLP